MTDNRQLKAYIEYGILKWLHDLHLPQDFEHKLDYAFTHQTIWNTHSSLHCLEQWFPAFLHCHYFSSIEHKYIQDVFQSYVQYDTLHELGAKKWKLFLQCCCSHKVPPKRNCGLECQPCVMELFRQTFCTLCVDNLYKS